LITSDERKILMQDEPTINPILTPTDPQPINPPNGAESEPANDTVAAQPLTELGPDDMKSYLMLRQSIDGFQTAALAFYATGKNVQERAERAMNVEFFATEFKLGVTDDECPAGQRPDAHGNCFPHDGLSFNDAGVAGGNA
jgi:hypothetical protein